MVINFNINSETKTFFLKRFHHPHYKDVANVFFELSALSLRAKVEWENANLLLRNGIETYHPVCMGQSTICGFERQSFFMTEKLSGCCLTDFISQNWANMQKQQRGKILSSVAKRTRNVRDADISLPDLYLWHFFITEKNDEFDLSVIDLHRMKRNVTCLTSKLKNLGKLYHSMVNKYFSYEQKLMVLKSYAGENFPLNMDKLISKIKKYSDHVPSRRNHKPY